PGFLLAHCGGGQDKPGFLGPSAETPALFFLTTNFIASNLKNIRCAENNWKLRQRFAHFCQVTSSRPCPSEQEISTTFLRDDDVAQPHLQIAGNLKQQSGPCPLLNPATPVRGATAAAGKRRLRGSNPDGIES